MKPQLMKKWQCPRCSHSLDYDPKHIDVINIAKVRHLLDTHKMTTADIVNLDSTLQTTVNEYFQNGELFYHNQKR